MKDVTEAMKKLDAIAARGAVTAQDFTSIQGYTPIKVIPDEVTDAWAVSTDPWFKKTAEQMLEEVRATRSAEARAAEMERKAKVEREHHWFSEFDLITDGIVEAQPYADQGELAKGDLVIICRGEYQGHVGVIESIHRANSSGVYAKLRRVWPATWRGPSGQYWPPEHVFGAFDKLVPVVPEFKSVAQAEWWMHDARDIQVGQDVAFSIAVCSAKEPWLERHTAYDYSGTIVQIEEFDLPYWYRNRPLARGRFQVLAFDDEMDPMLTWVEELVRL